jgi:hypothetical protein
MSKPVTLIALAGLLLAGPVYSQTKSSARSIENDLTINAADGSVYAGRMTMAVEKGKVSGTMLITKPTEITGTVAGTAEKGAMKLAFPYAMTERKCQGTVKMDLTIPAKPGPVTGTMEAVGCGRDETQKLTGTVELVPVKK